MATVSKDLLSEYGQLCLEVEEANKNVDRAVQKLKDCRRRINEELQKPQTESDKQTGG